MTPYLASLIEEAKNMRKNKRSPYLFPASYANKPISSQALAKWMHEQKEFSGKLVPHGLRTIGRSWFADHEIPFEVAEACLAHVVGSQVVRAYQRGDYFAARQKIMPKWHAYIQHCAQCAQLLNSPSDNSGVETT